MISTVNASVVGVSGQQPQAWPQRIQRGLLCRSTNNRRVPRASKLRQTCPFRAEYRYSAAARTNSTRIACSASRKTLPVRECRPRSESQHSSDSPAELFVKLSCRLVELLAAVVLTAQPLPAQAGEIIQGMPRVADGDTLQIEGQKIRLYGFDAPEKAQLCKNAAGADYSCGLQSGEALHSMIGSNPVRCEVRNKDQYGRNVSSCSVLTNKGPVDIGNFMVSNGYAVAYRQYGKDYIAVEDAAHQAHKGMWQGSFEMPADWRKDQKIDKLLAQRGRSLQPQDASSNAVATLTQSSAKSQTSSQDGPANGCKIKGNINAKGDKIYHLPGTQYYERTQIDLPQGERWFCTERQAKDAGWRSAQ